MSKTVALSKLVEKLNLECLTPEIDISGLKIITAEINRPALQLTGYFDHFFAERVQIIGYVEYTYLENLSREAKIPVYEKLLSYPVPCLIYTSRTVPDEEFLKDITIPPAWVGKIILDIWNN